MPASPIFTLFCVDFFYFFVDDGVVRLTRATARVHIMGRCLAVSYRPSCIFIADEIKILCPGVSLWVLQAYIIYYETLNEELSLHSLIWHQLISTVIFIEIF